LELDAALGLGLGLQLDQIGLHGLPHFVIEDRNVVDRGTDTNGNLAWRRRRFVGRGRGRCGGWFVNRSLQLDRRLGFRLRGSLRQRGAFPGATGQENKGRTGGEATPAHSRPPGSDRARVEQ